MPCNEWSQLVERYRNAVAAYHEATKVLGEMPGTAFNELWQQAERARSKCVGAGAIYCTTNMFMLV